MNPESNSITRGRVVYKSNLWRLRNGGHSLKVHFMNPYGEVSTTVYWDMKAVYLDNILKYNKVYDRDLIDRIPEGLWLIPLAAQSDPLPNGVGDVPFLEDNFLPIANIRRRDEYNVVDCVAVCRIVGGLKIVTTQDNKTYKIRTLYLADENKDVVALHFWDEDARNFMLEPPFVIKIRRAIIRVHEGERELNVSSSILPEISTNNVSDDFDFEWRDSFLSKEPVEGYYKMTGVIHSFDFENLFYKACVICRTKLIECNGIYECTECKIKNKDFQYQHMVKIFVGEPSLELICFHEVVTNFIERLPNVAQALTNGPFNVKEFFKPITCKSFIFYVHMKNRTEHIVLAAIPTEE